MIKIVFRLQHLPGRQTAFARHFQRARKLAGVKVGGAHSADFPRLLQGVKRLEGFRNRRFRVRPVGKIEVDIIGVQAPE